MDTVNERVTRIDTGGSELPELGLRLRRAGEFYLPLPLQEQSYEHFTAPALFAANIPAQESEVWMFAGMTFLTVAASDFFGVLMADADVEKMFGSQKFNSANLAFVAPKAEISMTTEGEKGFINKRPRRVTLGTPFWTLVFNFGINQLFVRTSGQSRYQPSREAQFISALGAS
jgi:hypothetical protein